MYWYKPKKEKLQYLSEFTRIYRSYSEKQTVERELAILDLQVSEMFLPPLKNDRITGRMKYPPLVFAPQGAASHGGYGYIFDIDKMAELEDSDELQEDEFHLLDEIKEFWKKEDTSFKTRASYPDILNEWLPGDNWTGESGVAFPLYRMSGSQMDMEKLVRLGVSGLQKEIRRRMEEVSDPEHKKLYVAMLGALEVLKKLFVFYIGQIDEMLIEYQGNPDHLLEMRSALANLGENAPGGFLEAVQLVHLYVLVSGSNNYGRLDVALAGCYEADKQSGKPDEYFINILESFWEQINFRKIIWDGRVIVGGKDRQNIALADELAILIMEATRRVKDVLPQLTLRCYDGMDEKTLRKAYQVIGEGNPYPMLYNDDINIPAASKAFEVSMKTAEECIPFGCGEYVLYHRSYGTPSGVINLLKVLEISLRKGRDPFTGRNMGTEEANSIPLDSFENLYEAYRKNLEHYCYLLALQEKFEYDFAAQTAPFLFLSMLFDNCIEKGKAIFDGGIEHLGGTLETYGNTNTGDSLYVIRKMVYEDKLISLEKLVEVLDTDYKGNEKLRNDFISLPKYGNNIDDVDRMMERVHTDVCNITRSMASRVGLDSYLVVNINNSANTILGKFTGASADGRKSGTSMANGNTPTMGRDTEGITALLSSLVKMPVDIHAGASQNIKFSRDMFRGKLEHTRSLIRSYFKMGGAQLMITCVGREDLENAMKEPEKYSNLLVRVGGFSARFVELDREVQEEILNRTLYD